MNETVCAVAGGPPSLPGRLLPGVIALFALLFSPLCASAVDVPGAGGVVLNGETIGAEEIWQEYSYQNSLRKFIHNRPDDRVDEKLLGTVIEQKVRKHLLLQEARRLGYVLEEKDRAEVRRAQVEGWKGEANFRNALAMMGVEEGFILNRGGETRLINRMLDAESKAGKGITRKMLLEHYGENPGRFLSEKLSPLRYIFFPWEAGNPRNAYTLIAREAETLRNEGKSYASLPERYSKHESAAGGGIVPGRAKGETGLPLQPAEGGLKECRISSYKTDEQGMHVYLQDCRQPPPFGEVEGKVREDLVAARRAEFLSDLGTRLRDKASIAYLPLEGPPPLKGGQGH